MFTLTIETDNAAFGDDPTAELRRILMVTAEKVARGLTEGSLLDLNGNTVGRFELT